MAIFRKVRGWILVISLMDMRPRVSPGTTFLIVVPFDGRVLMYRMTPLGKREIAVSAVSVISSPAMKYRGPSFMRPAVTT